MIEVPEDSAPAFCSGSAARAVTTKIEPFLQTCSTKQTLTLFFFCPAAAIDRQKGVSPRPSNSLLSLRDDDDINDVASMAGVNLTEESANILATNSELVGTVTRSCKDETFLHPSLLGRRALEIGEARRVKRRRGGLSVI